MQTFEGNMQPRPSPIISITVMEGLSLYFTITNKNDLCQIILKVNTCNLLICVRVIDFLIKNYTFIPHRAHYISSVYQEGCEPSRNVYAVKKYYYIYYKLQFKRYVGIERFLQSQRGLFFSDATKFYF